MTRDRPTAKPSITRGRKRTSSAIAEAKPAARPYQLTDSGGLYVEVQPTGKTSGVIGFAWPGAKRSNPW